MEAVGEVDLVDCTIGAGSGVGESVGDCGHGEDAPAPGNEAVPRKRSACVEDGYARDLLGRLDLANESAALWRARIAVRGHDDGHRRLRRQLRADVRKTPRRDRV